MRFSVAPRYKHCPPFPQRTALRCRMQCQNGQAKTFNTARDSISEPDQLQTTIRPSCHRCAIKQQSKSFRSCSASFSSWVTNSGTASESRSLKIAQILLPPRRRRRRAKIVDAPAIRMRLTRVRGLKSSYEAGSTGQIDSTSGFTTANGIRSFQ